MPVQALEEGDEAYRYPRFAARSFSDEFGSTIDNDVLLLQVAVVAILIYTVSAISDCKDGCVGSRIALTIGGVLPHLGTACAGCQT